MIYCFLLIQNTFIIVLPVDRKDIGRTITAIILPTFFIPHITDMYTSVPHIDLRYIIKTNFNFKSLYHGTNRIRSLLSIFRTNM